MNVDYKWLIIGLVLGFYVLPMLLGRLGGMGKKAPKAA